MSLSSSRNARMTTLRSMSLSVRCRIFWLVAISDAARKTLLSCKLRKMDRTYLARNKTAESTLNRHPSAEINVKSPSRCLTSLRIVRGGMSDTMKLRQKQSID